MDFYTTAIAQGFAFASLALGIFISLRILNLPDITTDGSFTLGAAVTALIISNELPVWLALILSPAVGFVAGSLTGFIHTRLKVHALLAGIIVMTGLYSVNLFLMGQPNIPLLAMPTVFNAFQFTSGLFLNKLLLLMLIAGFLIVTLYYFLKTDFGISMRALGSSETMLRANGVNTNGLKISGLAIANSFSAFSGSLLAQYQGFADVNMGIGIVISGLAAVMIGESVLFLFKNENILLRLIAVIAGAVVFRLILAFALASGLNPNYLKLITALMVLVIVAFAGLKNKTEKLN